MAVLPELSVTVQVMVVVPNAYGSLASFVTLATPQLSAVVAEPNATPLAVQMPASLVVVTFAGAVIVGTSVSVTVTV